MGCVAKAILVAKPKESSISSVDYSVFITLASSTRVGAAGDRRSRKFKSG
jgi:hypothetical protein